MTAVVREEEGPRPVEVVRGQLDGLRLEALRQAVDAYAAESEDAARAARSAGDGHHRRPVWPGPLYGDRRPSPWRRPAG